MIVIGFRKIGFVEKLMVIVSVAVVLFIVIAGAVNGKFIIYDKISSKIIYDYHVI